MLIGKATVRYLAALKDTFSFISLVLIIVRSLATVKNTFFFISLVLIIVRSLATLLRNPASAG